MRSIFPEARTSFLYKTYTNFSLVPSPGSQHTSTHYTPANMESLSLTANIIAVLTLAGQLLAAGYRYGSSSAQFPPELRRLVQEVTALSGVLHAVKMLVDDPTANARTTNGSSGDLIRAMGEPVEQCRKFMEEILRDLQKYGEASRRRGAWRVCWPLKEKATKEWCERLERHKSLFELALSVDEM